MPSFHVSQKGLKMFHAAQRKRLSIVNCDICLWQAASLHPKLLLFVMQVHRRSNSHGEFKKPPTSVQPKMLLIKNIL